MQGKRTIANIDWGPGAGTALAAILVMHLAAIAALVLVRLVT